MAFHIVFNKVTWYSKLLSVIFLFVVFPYIVFIIGQRYQEYIDLMNGANYMSLDWHNSDYQQDYNPRNNEQYILENKIEGKWRNISDAKFVLIFRDLNRYFEYYDGSVVNSGAWFLKQSLANTKFSNLPSDSGYVNSGGKEPTTYLYERLINGSQSSQSDAKKTQNKNSLDLYNNDFIYKIAFSPDYSSLTLTYLETGEVMNFARERYNPGSLDKVN
ncbi:MAG: hypothetical protein WCQ00_01230 [bacterium]